LPHRKISVSGSRGFPSSGYRGRLIVVSVPVVGWGAATLEGVPAGGAAMRARMLGV
jgi:hypothetical protein